MNDSNKTTAARLVRRWALVNVTDISRTESWLEHMAAQGLFFHNVSRWSILAPGPLWIVLFRKDTPRPERRYRLCPTRPQEAEPSQETLELYAQSGWQFLRYWGTSCVSYYLFYSDDPAAPEPYTDPDSLYEALRPPKKDVLNDLLLGGVLYTSAVILRATQILDRQLSFLPNWILAAAAALLIALWLISLLLNGIDWLTVLALRQEIRRRDTVRPTPPSALFAARCFFSSLLSLLQTGLLAVALALIFTLLRINSDLPLEQFDPDFDLLTLSEMEGDGSWTPDPDLEVADQLLRFNAADVYQDPARGVQMWYDVSQAGYGTSGDSSMDLNYFVSDDAQAAWELLAGLVQDLQNPDGDLLSYLPDQLPFQRETVPGAEEFLVRREGENWDVVALEGDRVLAMRYYNAATMKRNPIFSPIQTYYIVQQGGTGAAGYGQMDLYYYIAAGSEHAWAQLADLTQRVARERNFGDSAPDQLDFQRETVPGAEEFLVHREEENWDVVALEGDRVLRLTYNGALVLTEWYDEIAAMLTPVNETA